MQPGYGPMCHRRILELKSLIEAGTSKSQSGGLLPDDNSLDKEPGLVFRFELEVQVDCNNGGTWTVYHFEGCIPYEKFDSHWFK